MSNKAGRMRLDDALVHLGLAESKSLAAALVMSGQVLVNGARVDKAGQQVNEEARIELRESDGFVGRGALKLEEAFRKFPLSVRDQVCADVGASTGGFTEVMLLNGAAKIYAIDVGYGELDWKLRKDPRVVTMERTNARHLESLPEKVKFASIDVSFISLKVLLPVIKGWLDTQAQIIALIKPQFEAAKEEVEDGGLVTSAKIRQRVAAEVLNFALAHGLRVKGLIKSPIKGRKGNQEYLAWLDNFSEDFEEIGRLLLSLDEEE